MKFRVMIDPAKDEEVVATVHAYTPLVDELEAIVTASERPEEMTGYTADDIVRLAVSEIESVYVEDGKTYAAYADGKQYRIRMRLYEAETLLPPTFVRINKSAFANWAKVKRFVTEFSGAVDMEFLSGHRDYVSRRCFAEIRRRYDL